jgi:hypothetical protein
MEKHKPPEEVSTKAISEDKADFLREKLTIIKDACKSYDIEIANNALYELRNKVWPRHIKSELDTISQHLLHSQLKKAAEVVTGIMESMSE